MLSDNLLSNERTLKNMTMHTGEVDLRNLQLTAKLVSSPLTNSYNNLKNTTKNINLIDRFQTNSDIRNNEQDQYNYNEKANLNATNDMYLA